MDWPTVLAAAQAVPPAQPALGALVGELWPGAEVTHVRLLPGGLGSVLHRVDLAGAPAEAVVLRQLLREFGDDADTVRREVEVHAACAAAGVPVPGVHWSDPDGDRFGRPALLLSFVPGQPLVADLVHDAGRRAIAATLHRLASVPVDALRSLPRLDSLEAAVTRFEPPPDSSEVVDATALNAHVASLTESFEPGGALVHLDLHAGNVLWDGTAITGIVDWPGAAVGNPLADEAYLWFDTCLAHGRAVADALQEAVDAARPGAAPSGAARHLWRGVALQRGLPSPAEWTESYRAMAIDIDEDTVTGRFVALVDEYLQEE